LDARSKAAGGREVGSEVEEGGVKVWEFEREGGGEFVDVVDIFYDCGRLLWWS
jgi:hypothetical protein